MNIFDEELLNFWRTLSRFNVKYIMVGGVATNLNSYQRSTQDIDVWIEDTKENRLKFREAFKEYSGVYIANIYDVNVPFLHINHLITNKKDVNRPKDQLDVIYLEKIKKIQEENQYGENP